MYTLPHSRGFLNSVSALGEKRQLNFIKGKSSRTIILSRSRRQTAVKLLNYKMDHRDNSL